jgi:16S rRNA (guanine527-N7)-methyltransferase
VATLSIDQIARLLKPYSPEASHELHGKLSAYLDLLLKWNARTNLTAIRDPEQIVQRHFGESLFAGAHLPDTAATLLDFGSGAGFPGLPIQLLRPTLKVTLAESQNKKATFLREAVRTLGLQTEVWADRVETMAHERRFDVVALRAVDNMPAALAAAALRVSPGGSLVILGSATGEGEEFAIPGTTTSVVRVQRV